MKLFLMPIAKPLAATVSALILGLRSISFVFSFGDYMQKLALARCQLAISRRFWTDAESLVAAFPDISGPATGARDKF
jgi:hypothetical protein